MSIEKRNNKKVVEIEVTKTSVMRAVKELEYPDKPETFASVADEINYFAKKHRVNDPIERSKGCNFDVTYNDVVREESPTPLFSEILSFFKNLWKMMTGTYKMEVPEEISHWVMPYDPDTDTLYLSKITEKEFRELKNHWNK